jgi:acetylornithine deacetylase/succinyl-diaminopimelate desuccinylase-like protein
LAVEVTVHGPRRELHSGQFGGAIHNPIQALAELLAGLHDSRGRVAIPDFYDSVRDEPDELHARMRRDGRSDTEILARAGVRRGWGEPGFTLHERTTIRPALVFTGTVGGWTRPGNQSIIPATATAKLGFRLVPGQTPDAVERQLRAHLAAIAPPTVRVEVRRLSAALPVRLDTRHPSFCVASAALRAGFGRSPVLLPSGGSIPVVATFLAELGVPPVLMGFGLQSDGMHGPNERFALKRFWRAVHSSTTLLQLATSLASSSSCATTL